MFKKGKNNLFAAQCDKEVVKASGSIRNQTKSVMILSTSEFL